MSNLRETRRLALQAELEELLAGKVAVLEDGSQAIYFQPPEKVKLKYPCVVYTYETDYFRHADDKSYYKKPQYELTVIDRNPDSDIADVIVYHFTYCRHNRQFTADNLRHDVIGLYY